MDPYNLVKTKDCVITSQVPEEVLQPLQDTSEENVPLGWGKSAPLTQEKSIEYKIPTLLWSAYTLWCIGAFKILRANL